MTAGLFDALRIPGPAIAVIFAAAHNRGLPPLQLEEASKKLGGGSERRLRRAFALRGW